MGKIIGIDFGTTNSVASVFEHGQPITILNQEGAASTPSVVAFTRSGELLVGQAAKRQSITNPEGTIFSVKRLLGRTYREAGEQLSAGPFKIGPGDNGGVLVEIDGQSHSPPEIAAMILEKLKAAAEDHLEQRVFQAVIAIPVGFNEFQRQALRSAANIAGLEVSRFIHQPAAAAWAHWHKCGRSQFLAVLDIGGGFLNTSIIDADRGVIEVRSSIGDARLGGDTIDQRIVDWLVLVFRDDQRIDLSKDPIALGRLREEAERAKMEVSTRLEAEVNVPFIAANAMGTVHLNMKLTRKRLEHIVEDVCLRSIGLFKRALREAEIRTERIDSVLLVGGSTRIPRVQAMVQDFFRKQPVHANSGELVAGGAALWAGLLSGDLKDSLILDVVSLSFGIETMGGTFTRMIARNTTTPHSKTQVFSTAADNQTSVEIRIFQGERDMARDNRLLRVLAVSNIPPAPRGVPQITVRFDIDANGVLNVRAECSGSGPVDPDRLLLPS